ncbi:MAG: phage tail protein [Pseudomonadota bacterium]
MTPMMANRFKVTFSQDPPVANSNTDLCGGAFSEVSGLEATMEPKVIRQGGHYRGEVQRVGQVTFATVILKRGVTPANHLWTWFDLLAGKTTSLRLNARVTHLDFYRDADGNMQEVERFHWDMKNAMPVKFKAATYSGTATDVGVEELHFVHEGLRFEVGETA